jgi:hypothetical protein
MRFLPAPGVRECAATSITSIFYNSAVLFSISMTNDDLLTDEFVADMLAKEAQDCSLKFSAMGMEAYRSNKK